MGAVSLIERAVRVGASGCSGAERAIVNTGTKDQSAAAHTAPPAHVAIIMDGNGRWAEQRGLPRAEGHRRGVDSVRTIVAAARELGIGYLTLYSFSSENWSRPPSEVSLLMGLLRHFLRRDLADLHGHRVRICIIGERAGVDSDIVTMLAEAEALTAGNTGLRLQIAFNYGSRDEISRAARRLAEAVAAGRLDPAAITPEALTAALDTATCPDPDLLIRTGGEVRLSNFLLWQAAYAELIFMPTFWPDFGRAHLEQAITEFRSRNRRYGGLGVRNDGMTGRS